VARLLPFAGLRFNSSLVPDLSAVLCPPYDIISREQRQRLYSMSPYNAVRLELAEPEGGADRYATAASTLDRWLRAGVLIREERPAFYLHEHSFTVGGRKLRRLGLLAAVDLGQTTVYPHEDTLKEPKEDRLRLLRACRTYFSPIFALYPDPQGKASRWLSSYIASHPPDLEIGGEEGHRVWVVTEETALEAIRGLFLPLPLFIADGHHRYETALAYGREDRNAGTAFMELVDAADPGLIVFTVHRLVTGVPAEVFPRLVEGLREDFDVHPVPPHSLAAPAGSGGLWLGVSFGEAAFLVSPRRGKALPATSLHLFHETILPRIVEEAPGCRIEYFTEIAALLEPAAAGKGIAFVVPSLGPEDLLRLSRSGVRLPGKATYFYPKLPAGLVFYSLD